MMTILATVLTYVLIALGGVAALVVGSALVVAIGLLAILVFTMMALPPLA